MRNIAIIPARSGSKGLKDKNIKLLNGKPLIAYTIESAFNSKIFDKIMVSTDSKEYANIAIKYGAEVPFLRSDELSGDTAGSWDVVEEVLLKYKEMGTVFDVVTLLQPTSPLRTSEDIIAAYELFKAKNANAIVTVCEVDHSPLWSNVLPDDKSMVDFLPKDKINKPRQALDTFYRLNGAVYMVRVDYFFTNKDNIYAEKCFASIMDKKHSVDIDDYLDFLFAETIIKNNNE